MYASSTFEVKNKQKHLNDHLCLKFHFCRVPSDFEIEPMFFNLILKLFQTLRGSSRLVLKFEEVFGPGGATREETMNTVTENDIKAKVENLSGKCKASKPQRKKLNDFSMIINRAAGGIFMGSAH